MELVMQSRFNLYLAVLLVLEAIVVRGVGPRFPQRQGTIVLAAELQRQATAMSGMGELPRRRFPIRGTPTHLG
jgi:hypothetical protein